MILCEEMNNIASTSIIPDHCLSFYEQSLYVAEAAHAAYNECFKEIGIEELAVFESTGSTIVYEDGSQGLADIKAKIVKIFTNIWASIKEAYEKMIKKIDEIAKTTRTKYVNKITVDGLKVIADDTKFGTIHEFKDADFVAMAKECNTKCAAFMMKIDSEFKKSTAENVKDVKESLSKELLTGVVGGSYESLDSYKTKKSEEVCGKSFEVDKKWVVDNFKTIQDVVAEGSMKSLLKGTFNQERLVIDNIIRSTKGIKAEDTFYIKDKAALLRDLVETHHSVQSLVISFAKKRFMEYRAVFNRVYLKADKVKAQDESATITSYQRDLVSEAFDW